MRSRRVSIPPIFFSDTETEGSLAYWYINLPTYATLLIEEISMALFATLLGIVGAGGIGLQLSERMRVQLSDQAAFVILVILVTVAIIDYLSRKIRERFIG